MTRIHLHALALVVAATAAASTAAACDEAVGWRERTVCQYEELQAQERRIGGQVAQLLRLSSSADRQRLRTEQDTWTQGLDACRAEAKPISCLTGRYQERLADIDRRIGREVQALHKGGPKPAAVAPPGETLARLKPSSLEELTTPRRSIDGRGGDAYIP